MSKTLDSTIEQYVRISKLESTNHSICLIDKFYSFLLKTMDDIGSLMNSVFDELCDHVSKISDDVIIEWKEQIQLIETACRDLPFQLLTHVFF